MAIKNDKHPHINLTNYSFNKWVNFAFNHPVGPEHQLKWWNSGKPYEEWPKKKDWYRLDKWDNYCNPVKLVKNVTQLFSNLKILDKYSDDQINQGLYYLAFGTELTNLLSDKTLSFNLRKACILSMENLYKDIFNERTIPDSSSMWWDWFEGVPRNWEKKPLSNDGKKLMKAMLDTLAKILKLKSPYCQKGALHGLGHLNQPRGKKLIGDFIKRNPSIEKSIKSYALKCKKGGVL